MSSNQSERELVVEIAKELCQLPSPIGEEGPLAAAVAARLEKSGFEVEMPEVVEDRPNVVAVLRGDPRRRSLMLNGHLDIGMPIGRWRRDPFHPWVEDDVLYGAGVQDMKGGLASILAAAIVTAQTEAPRGDIIITAVMQHGVSGLGIKHFLATTPLRIDAAVCAEPTDLKIQLAHGGAWVWQITTSGVVRHQSRLEEGVNAITGMVRILDQLDVGCLTFAPHERFPSLPRMVVGMIAGGEHPPVTAERCVARGDIRYHPGMRIDEMKADLERTARAVTEGMPGLTAQVTTISHEWPYEADEDWPVVRCAAASHHRVNGAWPEMTSDLPVGAYITDAADMVRHGIPTVLYGPGDWRTEPNEGIPVQDLLTATRVYVDMCATFARGVR